MDLNLLRTAVFEKTGIKIDTEDPIFALVALHETVLAISVAQQLTAIDAATVRLQQQSAELLAAGDYLKALLLTAGYPVDGVQPIGARMPAPVASSRPVIRWLATSCTVALLSAMLTVGGLWLARML